MARSMNSIASEKIVTCSGTADPLRMRQQICSYTYACDVTGNITFTRSGGCRTT